MNRALEFHDSVIKRASESDGELVLELRDAYIHQSSGRPGLDAGDGYLVALDLAFSGAQCDQELQELQGSVSEGSIIVNGEALPLLPVPFAASGRIDCSLTLSSGVMVRLRSEALRSIDRGTARWVERFPGR